MWTEASRILVPTVAPNERSVVFLNSATPLFMVCGKDAGAIPVANQWYDLDLSPLGVPADAVAVAMHAFIIITDGAQTGLADLAIAYQAPGASTNPLNYIGQAIAIGPSGGARTNEFCLVPCKNGHIEWAWLRGDMSKSGQWPNGPIPPYPTGAAYGLNITLQLVFMPEVTTS